ncbi:MAG: signal peptidase I [bacterium]|nr:signal peptidase I [bacterium]
MPNEQDILNSINANPDHGYQPGNNLKDSDDNYSKKAEVLAFIWETVKIVAISLAIIIPIRYYLVQPFFVKGASMEQNFHDGDYLLIDEISYRFHEPRRGDVIVFRYPENPSQFYIKRIIGLPGETVEVKNNKVKIYNAEFETGFSPKEYYLSDGQETFGNNMTQLKGDEYFVMGDNRLQSSDSRRWGPVAQKFITGRAFIRLWPVTKITKVEAVSY